jgi:hypothetical protein
MSFYIKLVKVISQKAKTTVIFGRKEYAIIIVLSQCVQIRAQRWRAARLEERGNCLSDSETHHDP